MPTSTLTEAKHPQSSIGPSLRELTKTQIRHAYLAAMIVGLRTDLDQKGQPDPDVVRVANVLASGLLGQKKQLAEVNVSINPDAKIIAEIGLLLGKQNHHTTQSWASEYGIRAFALLFEDPTGPYFAGLAPWLKQHGNVGVFNKILKERLPTS